MQDIIIIAYLPIELRLSMNAQNNSIFIILKLTKTFPCFAVSNQQEGISCMNDFPCYVNK